MMLVPAVLVLAAFQAPASRPAGAALRFSGFLLEVPDLWRRTSKTPGELRFEMDGVLGGRRLPPLRVRIRRAAGDLASLPAAEVLRRLRRAGLEGGAEPPPRARLRARRSGGVDCLYTAFTTSRESGGFPVRVALLIAKDDRAPLILTAEGPEPLVRSQEGALERLWRTLRSERARRPAAASQPAAGSRIEAVDLLRFAVPAAWKRRTPSSSMRLAEFEVPGPAGSATLAVFYFGPRSGSVRANLDRWKGQFSPAKDVDERAVPGTALPVTRLSVRGTFMNSMRPMGPKTPQPDSRLIGWIVRTRKGPFYFKLTGPAKTVDRWERAVDEVIRSTNEG